MNVNGVRDCFFLSSGTVSLRADDERPLALSVIWAEAVSFQYREKKTEGGWSRLINQNEVSRSTILTEDFLFFSSSKLLNDLVRFRFLFGWWGIAQQVRQQNLLHVRKSTVRLFKADEPQLLSSFLFSFFFLYVRWLALLTQRNRCEEIPLFKSWKIPAWVIWPYVYEGRNDVLNVRNAVVHPPPERDNGGNKVAVFMDGAYVCLGASLAFQSKRSLTKKEKEK